MFGIATPLTSSAQAPVMALAAVAILFAIKHYVADFIFQTNWIARGKERPQGWLPPLMVHASCHGVITLLIALALAPHLWWLAGVDIVVHFAIDRSKTLAAHWGRWQPDQAQFWWLLGFDQLLHQVTNIALATAFVLL